VQGLLLEQTVVLVPGLVLVQPQVVVLAQAV
jgi:hypothetical protein